jgi:hypothetical protein
LLFKIGLFFGFFVDMALGIRTLQKLEKQSTNLKKTKKNGKTLKKRKPNCGGKPRENGGKPRENGGKPRNPKFDPTEWSRSIPNRTKFLGSLDIRL